MINSKPTVIVSKCLGFAKCRYNGDTIPDKFVKELGNYVNYITVCPEVGIGLPIPRETIRLVLEDDEIKLFQPSTGRELTKDMLKFSEEFLSKLPEIDGFILKGRSPSCGTKNVKIYLGKEKAVGSIKGSGLFARTVKDKFPSKAIEEEGRLTNFKIREHFLTKLFTFFSLRQIKTLADLVKFQSDNKYLLMAYNQKEQKVLGRIIANHDKKDFKNIMKEYEEHLALAFARAPRYTSIINALQHIFGYFSDKLSPKERAFFLETLESYRENKIPLSVLIHLLKSYAIEYQQEYILRQTILSPYPEGLVNLRDSGNVN
ncbi:DUF523 and DUF1722 domain-containing protein [Clostridium sp. YIM B02515]|uniref:DUF523 and DUF1722 domain-containing protein n=1 Tax=Clostridium rhizosphaerae TaxID=2803861 RepID=A0ABS1THD2_9CLOT|nr:DUF523 and DUF1722 domain-containing protein [Clostridium rhizosphaerae]MBL4937358.1 DUF523 and DUF1722 domain-containing protein [Clostridium rhizosphaerae]